MGSFSGTFTVDNPDDPNTGIGAIQFKRKTGDESVTSSTTVQIDDHLQGFVLETNTRYEVELVLEYDAAQGGDLAFILQNGTSTPGSGFGSVVALHQGATGLNEVRNMPWRGSGVTWTTFVVGGQGATRLACLVNMQFDSDILTSLDLWWAQGTSNGTATRIFAESYMKVTRLS